MQTCKLAIDVGGTFTDVVLYDEAGGTLAVHKLLSTNDDPSRGSAQGARELLARCGLDGARLDECIHATTVATNAVIERKGARTALITTRGFRDVLEIRNEDRYDIYDLNLRTPAPLVERRLRLELDERIDGQGRVVTPLDDEQALALLRQLRDEGVDSVAVCLLNAHLNPCHEQRLCALAEAFPALSMSVSHQVSNEVREFERTSTTVVDAYVKPAVRQYMDRLADALRGLGLRSSPALMLSNGGIGSAVEVARSYPVRMIESGPAAGAVLAAHLSRTSLDGQDLVALDIGGTTAKVSLIQQGQPELTQLLEVAHLQRFHRGSGFPLQISAIELLEISGGGGSIARLNALRSISVGPDSAGAMPGPVAFGRGGTQPTVTDCDLVLGYLDPERFAGGAFRLDLAAARAAVEAQLAGPMGMTVERAAQGVVDLIDERMAAAVRVHAAEKGVDLRGFALMAFGGNGPLHAYGVARTLGMRRIVVPYAAGVASAVGCVVAEPAIDFTEPLRLPLAALDWPRLEAMRDDALMRGSEALAAFTQSARVEMRASVDLRCAGQGYHIAVTLPPRAEAADLQVALARRFGERYQALYGHPPPVVALEAVNVRWTACIERVSAPLAMPAGQAQAAPVGQRDILVGGATVRADIYERAALPVGSRFQGPALVVERESTTLVGPGATFHVHPHGHLIVDLF